MKTGIAKDNYGIQSGQFSPVDPKDGFQILKGHKYVLPENYDLTDPGSIFEPEKKAKEK